MNILSDFEIRLNSILSQDCSVEVQRLSKLLQEKEQLIIKYADQLNKDDGYNKPNVKKAVKKEKTKTASVEKPIKKSASGKIVETTKKASEKPKAKNVAGNTVKK